jgi:hypothetical protein
MKEEDYPKHPGATSGAAPYYAQVPVDDYCFLVEENKQLKKENENLKKEIKLTTGALAALNKRLRALEALL